MKTKTKNYLNILDKQLLFVIYIGFLVYVLATHASDSIELIDSTR